MKRVFRGEQQIGPNGAYPMEIRNGKVVGAWQQHTYEYRAPFAKDYDFTQRPFRRFVNASGAFNVQLPSGLEKHQWQGIRYPYRGSGWIWGFMSARQPGQTRSSGSSSGRTRPNKGASDSQIQKIWDATYRAQPQTPAGTGPPGQFYGDFYDMPGTG